MDVYSNVLYVQINQPELAQLAHQAFEVDKYRVETCCIVGNLDFSRVSIKTFYEYILCARQATITDCEVSMKKLFSISNVP